MRNNKKGIFHKTHYQNNIIHKMSFILVPYEKIRKRGILYRNSCFYFRAIGEFFGMKINVRRGSYRKILFLGMLKILYIVSNLIFWKSKNLPTFFANHVYISGEFLHIIPLEINGYPLHLPNSIFHSKLTSCKNK